MQYSSSEDNKVVLHLLHCYNKILGNLHLHENIEYEMLYSKLAFSVLLYCSIIKIFLKGAQKYRDLERKYFWSSWIGIWSAILF